MSAKTGNEMFNVSWATKRAEFVFVFAAGEGAREFDRRKDSKQGQLGTTGKALGARREREWKG